jgi:hypothetical protein
VASLAVWNPKDSASGQVDYRDVRLALANLRRRFPQLEKLIVDEGAEAGAVLPFCRESPDLALVTAGFVATPEENMKLWSALAARVHALTLSLPRHPRLLDELVNLRQAMFAFGSRWRVIDASKRLHRDVSLSVAGAVFAAGEALTTLAGDLSAYVVMGKRGRAQPEFSAFDRYNSDNNIFNHLNETDWSDSPWS